MILRIFLLSRKMQAHLIVDGNNALHSVKDLNSILRHDRREARNALVRLLQPIHDEDGYRVTVVFDGREGIGSIQKFGSDDTFSIVYSSSEQSADGVIERMLLAARNPEVITVATNDNLIRNCAYEVGASALRTEDLPKWVDRAVSRRVAREGNTSPAKVALPFRNSIEIPDDFKGK